MVRCQQWPNTKFHRSAAVSPCLVSVKGEWVRVCGRSRWVWGCVGGVGGCGGVGGVGECEGV